MKKSFKVLENVVRKDDKPIERAKCGSFEDEVHLAVQLANIYGSCIRERNRPYSMHRSNTTCQEKWIDEIKTFLSDHYLRDIKFTEDQLSCPIELEMARLGENVTKVATKNDMKSHYEKLSTNWQVIRKYTEIVREDFFKLHEEYTERYNLLNFETTPDYKKLASEHMELLECIDNEIEGLDELRDSIDDLITKKDQYHQKWENMVERCLE